MPSPAKTPLCLIIAGPNGAGKTTFATEFLPREAAILHFVNADLIAAGLSPLKPSSAALSAGRVFLSELDRLATARQDFAFESTLSGLTYVDRIKRWKGSGYRINLIYLRLATPEVALKRIASRVKEGGHHVPAVDVRRRFVRSWRNFENVYLPLCDAWWLYDANVRPPVLIKESLP
jgi:predicted ABC-type ATPase